MTRPLKIFRTLSEKTSSKLEPTAGALNCLSRVFAGWAEEKEKRCLTAGSSKVAAAPFLLDDEMNNFNVSKGKLPTLLTP